MALGCCQGFVAPSLSAMQGERRGGPSAGMWQSQPGLLSVSPHTINSDQIHKSDQDR